MSVVQLAHSYGGPRSACDSRGRSTRRLWLPMRRKSISDALLLVGPVNENGCRLWQGLVGRDGYGRYYGEGQGWQAPRLVWTLLRGPIPKGLFVCHRCDVKLCVNIEDLFLGTPKDNSQDMARKERSALGERNGSRKYPERLPHGDTHHFAKLSYAKAREIRARYCARRVTQEQLAAEFGVTRGAIHQILHDLTWRESMAGGEVAHG